MSMQPNQYEITAGTPVSLGTRGKKGRAPHPQPVTGTKADPPAALLARPLSGKCSRAMCCACPLDTAQAETAVSYIESFAVAFVG